MKVEAGTVIALLSMVGAWIFSSMAAKAAVKSSAKAEGVQTGMISQRLDSQSVVLGEIKSSIGDIKCVVDNHTERIVRLETIVDLRRNGVKNEHIQ